MIFRLLICASLAVSVACGDEPPTRSYNYGDNVRRGDVGMGGDNLSAGDNLPAGDNPPAGDTPAAGDASVFTVGGTVTGLAGTGLVLLNNGGDNLAIPGNGSFTFGPRYPDSASYLVTVGVQPTGLSQTCDVASGDSTIAGANVTNIVVTCTTDTFLINVNVANLIGDSVTVDTPGAPSDLVITSNGVTPFPAVADGTAFDVSIVAQPESPTQVCTVQGGSGTIAGSNVTVNITCSAPMYTVSARVSGLDGSGLVLENDGDTLPVTGNGDHTFAIALNEDDSYDVTVTTQPLAPPQRCAVQNGSGTISADVIVNVSCETYHVAFVTSSVGTGDLNSWNEISTGVNGLGAADTICQVRATAGNLPGTFRAWASDDTSDAYCRIHNLAGKKANNCNLGGLPAVAGPWVRTDGMPFAEFVTDMLEPNNVIYAPPLYDEAGIARPGRMFYSGTNSAGELEVAAPCNNWLSAGAFATRGGDTESVDLATWGSSSCGAPNSLLCFRVGGGITLDVPTTTGKLVFLSSVEGTGNIGGWPLAGLAQGLTAADEVCDNLAQAASLPGSFTAWLSDTGVNAADRVGQTGPWVRRDGVLVASSFNQLTTGDLDAPINVTETGQYLNGEYAWTGSSNSGTALTENCAGWTNDTAGSTGGRSLPTYTSTRWTRFGVDPCWVTYHLYCFQD